jgi:Lon protease-like protein
MDDDAIEPEFPLFPLGLVAVPHELVPLHIFEARYRVMIGDCLDEEREFGILWATDDDEREIGCAVEIAEVVERLEDGRINIVVRGTRPFRALDRTDALGYPAGTVEWIEDVEEEPDEEARAEAQAAYRTLVSTATEHTLDEDDVAEMDAYRMAATVEFGSDAKQALLELRSENARLRLLTRLFRAATKRLELIGRAEARARSNGKVRFG